MTDKTGSAFFAPINLTAIFSLLIKDKQVIKLGARETATKFDYFNIPLVSKTGQFFKISADINQVFMRKSHKIKLLRFYFLLWKPELTCGPHFHLSTEVTAHKGNKTFPAVQDGVVARCLCLDASPHSTTLDCLRNLCKTKNWCRTHEWEDNVCILILVRALG